MQKAANGLRVIEQADRERGAQFGDQ